MVVTKLEPDALVQSSDTANASVQGMAPTGQHPRAGAPAVAAWLCRPGGEVGKAAFEVLAGYLERSGLIVNLQSSSSGVGLLHCRVHYG